MQIQVGRYGELLQKVLGIRDRNPSGDVAPEVVPTIEVDTALRAEYNYLHGIRQCCGSIPFAAPGAGLTSHLLLTNPTNSQTLVVLDRVYSDGNPSWQVSVEFLIGVMNVPETTGLISVNTSVHDQRDPANVVATGNRRTTAILEYKNTASIGAFREYYRARKRTEVLLGQQGVVDWHGQPLILRPGTQAVMYWVFVNQAYWIGCYWRERSLTELEQ